jgi:hypothetical protein
LYVYLRLTLLKAEKRAGVRIPGPHYYVLMVCVTKP